MNRKNPLAKLEIIISVLGCLAVLGALVPVAAHLADRGSVFGDGPVCASAPYSNLVDSSGKGVSGAHVSGLAAGVEANPQRFELCTDTATTHQRLLSTLKGLPSGLLFLGFLFVTWRGTRQARRRGPFTQEVAASISTLGAFLFFGQLVVTFIQAFAAQHLVDSMLTEGQDNDYFLYLHVSLVVLIAAFGLQALGRVMAMTVPMQREIDATV
jgi:hypothetical protein